MKEEEIEELNSIIKEQVRMFDHNPAFVNDFWKVHNRLTDVFNLMKTHLDAKK